MPLIDLLRIFQRGERNGRLMLWNQHEWAMIWFCAGQAAHAIVLEQQDRSPIAAGEAAFFHTLAWLDGSFRFMSAQETSNHPISIKRPTSELIVEAAQRRTVEPRAPAVAPLTAQTPLRLLTQLNGSHEAVYLSNQEWLVLTRIEAQITVADLAARLGFELRETIALVTRLVEFGLVAPAPLSDIPARQLTVEPPPALTARRTNSSPITNLTRAIRRRLSQLNASPA